MTEAVVHYSGDPRQVSLAKTLKDTGFDVVQEVGDGWLRGTSLSSPLVVHVRWKGDQPELALPRLGILAPALAAAGAVSGDPSGTSCELVSLPAVPADGISAGSASRTDAPVTACTVPGLVALDKALAAAFQATRGIGLLPPVEAFQLATQGMPRTTEAERLVVQRVGQQVFREALEKRWGGRCAITGIDVSELLRASHIKPWARCATDAERLDPDNGLLLAVNWDAVFDRGLVTFGADGTPLWSPRCPVPVRVALGLGAASLGVPSPGMANYLAWHRAHVFQHPPTDARGEN